MKNKIFCCSILLCIMVLLMACESGNTVYLESDTQEELSESSSEEEHSEKSVSRPASYYVYICGRVTNPGVYEVSENARICDVVALAGGLLEDAALDFLNQAERITDGQMIRVLSVEEALEENQANVTGNVAATDTRVNLNTATEDELMQLPGIGQSKAQSIIAYRSEQGGFADIAELTNIPGIKEGVFSKIKDSIKVN